MVPLATSSIMKEEDKGFVDDLVWSAEVFSDEEEEDNDALNTSCHGNHFKRMYEPEGCGKLAVKRRKLQTHLQTLDLDFLALKFDKDELGTDNSSGPSSSLRDPVSERLRKSPRRQKTTVAKTKATST